MRSRSCPNDSLYLITDRHQVPAEQSLLNTLEQALAAGVRLVQLREKDLPAAELWPLCQQLRALTNKYSAKLLINDRIDLALACAADGVHLGEHSLPVTEARKLIGPNRLIGVSTHSADEVILAGENGADFCTYGPVFPTPSKAAYGPPQGLDKLSHACRQAQLPVYALGGIKPAQIADVLNCGVSGVALISAIMTAADPAKAAADLLRALHQPQ